MDIKTTSRTVTIDPIQFEAIATITVNGQTVTGQYTGDVDQTRGQVKKAAIDQLKINAKKLGMTI